MKTIPFMRNLSSVRILFTLALFGCIHPQEKSFHTETISLQKNPERLSAINLQDAFSGSFEKFRLYNEMREYSAGKYSFYMDLYPVSEMRPGHYFSCANCMPLRDIAFQKAKLICRTMGKRLCTHLEWKKVCFSESSLEKKVFQEKGCLFQAKNENQDEKSKKKPESGIGEKEANSLSPLPCLFDFPEIKQNFYHEKISREWTIEEKSGRPVLSGKIKIDGKSMSCTARLFVPENYRMESAGFRCCRDR
ncbi:MAG: hypothetical protein OEZ34_05840 [Spirochaetia bacterium]|nr:hypothetical protein [Spirochaetia bacterium]